MPQSRAEPTTHHLLRPYRQPQPPAAAVVQALMFLRQSKIWSCFPVSVTSVPSCKDAAPDGQTAAPLFLGPAFKHFVGKADTYLPRTARETEAGSRDVIQLQTPKRSVAASACARAAPLLLLPFFCLSLGTAAPRQ